MQQTVKRLSLSKFSMTKKIFALSENKNFKNNTRESVIHLNATHSHFLSNVSVKMMDLEN